MIILEKISPEERAGIMGNFKGGIVTLEDVSVKANTISFTIHTPGDRGWNMGYQGSNYTDYSNDAYGNTHMNDIKRVTPRWLSHLEKKYKFTFPFDITKAKPSNTEKYTRTEGWNEWKRIRIEPRDNDNHKFDFTINAKYIDTTGKLGNINKFKKFFKD